MKPSSTAKAAAAAPASSAPSASSSGGVRDASLTSAEEAAINDDIAVLRALRPQLGALRDAYLSTGRRKTKDEYETTLKTAESILQRAAGRVRAMEVRTRDGFTAGQLNRDEARLRISVSSQLTQTLLREAQDHQLAAAAFDKRLQQQLSRRVMVRYTDRNGTHKSQEECDAIAKRVLRAKQQQYLFLQARAELEDAVDQHHELIELQGDIAEMLKLIRHMQMLVQWQREQLEYIDGRVDYAHDKLKQGVKHLKDGREGNLFGSSAGKSANRMTTGV